MSKADYSAFRALDPFFSVVYMDSLAAWTALTGGR
jgi:hypothetical protein